MGVSGCETPNVLHHHVRVTTLRVIISFQFCIALAAGSIVSAERLASGLDTSGTFHLSSPKGISTKQRAYFLYRVHCYSLDIDSDFCQCVGCRISSVKHRGHRLGSLYIVKRRTKLAY